MKKISLFILLMCQFSFGQLKDSFSKGLFDGWNQTLNETKDIDIFSAGSPNPNNCSTIPMYSQNDKDKDFKEYNRGYRCGVEQAVKVIPVLQKKLQNKIQTQGNVISNYNSNTSTMESELQELKRWKSAQQDKLNSMPESQQYSMSMSLDAEYNRLYSEIISKYDKINNRGMEQSNITNNNREVTTNNRNQIKNQIDFYDGALNQNNKQIENSSNYLQAQSEFQRKQNSNTEKINNAISDIYNQIANLNYSQNIKNDIKKDFNNYIEDINNFYRKDKTAILNDKYVMNSINYLYQSVENSIKTRVQEYENKEFNELDKNEEFVINFNNGYNILSEDDNLVKEINLNRADKKKYDELLKKRAVMLQNALPYFEKAIQLNPKHENTKKILNFIYEQLGQTGKIIN